MTVNDYSTTDNYGSLTTAYPAPGATNAYTDGELALTFDARADAEPGRLDQDLQEVRRDPGRQHLLRQRDPDLRHGTARRLNVGSQLARVSGNTVFFTPHLGKLAYGSAYYVVIPTMSIGGTLNGMPFDGFSNLSTVATWNFTTRAAPTLDATNITVDGAQTSTANFRTVRERSARCPESPATTSVHDQHRRRHVQRARALHRPGGLTQTVNIVGPAPATARATTASFSTPTAIR